jgi:hypothetical protein
MLWLVLLGAAVMGVGLLLVLVQRAKARSVAPGEGQQAAPPQPAPPASSWRNPDQTGPVRFVGMPYAAPAAVRPGPTPARVRPLGAIPPGWCAPPPFVEPYSPARAQPIGSGTTATTPIAAQQQWRPSPHPRR